MARLDWSRLHSKILRSSIWLEDPIVRLVWICALADSETDGTFYGSYEVLSRAWNLPVADVKTSMERLCAPDPNSSTPDYEGRRIIQEDVNSWHILNKRLYNPSGEPSGASTPRVIAFRERQRAETDETGNGSNGGNALEEKREEENRTEKRDIVHTKVSDSDFDEWWKRYPRKVGKGAAQKAWRSMSSANRKAAQDAVGGFAVAWTNAPQDQKRFCPHAKTWLDRAGWEDDPAEWARSAGTDEEDDAPRNVLSANPREEEIDREIKDKLADELRARGILPARQS